MSIAQQLDDALKAAMRQRDSARVACIRQLRSKVQEATHAKGFSGDVDDALYQQVIASYLKQLEVGIAQMGSAGERGEALATQYRAEIAYLTPYLPRRLDEAETRRLVDEALVALQVTDVKQAGRVLGHLIKQHGKQIDPGLAKRLIATALGG